MDFIFRLHQAAFDPSDEQEITKNWEWIKEAISFASTTLYHAIEGKTYQELNPNQQLKIYKYLLRSRYRCTPFGLWAGIGLGTWNKKTSTNISLNALPINDGRNESISAPDPFSADFLLAPGLSIAKHHIFFWAYSGKDEGWVKSYAERNKLVDLVLGHFRENKQICYKEFRAFIQSTDVNAIQALWKKVITTGILRSDHAQDPASKSRHINLKLNQEICLSHNIRKQLELLPQEMGALFVKSESSYLNKFRTWFANTYDDRFVSLSKLLEDRNFNPVLFLSIEYESPKPDRLKGNLWGSCQSLDLKTQFPSQQIQDIYQLQFAYKLGDQETIILENIACNRPFAYAGRYSKDEQVYSFLSKNLSPAFAGTEVIYADLNLFESGKSNIITQHQNLFRHSISFTRAGDGKYIFGMEDLWIGIQNGRIILYSELYKKQVIPIVQHPLNPNYISHPVSRILWEVSHQDNYKFLPYRHAGFQDSEYVPRLYWGKTVLQPRRWRIFSKDIQSKKQLHDTLTKKSLPDEILAGYQDRELLLNLKREQDLDLLYDEVKSQKYCDLYECLWKDSSPFRTGGSAQVYPQFIYSWTRPRLEKPQAESINRVKGQNPQWVYIRMGISEFSLMPFFEKSFAEMVQQIKSTFNIKNWYFLVYRLPDPEIRLRICLDDPKESPGLFSLLTHQLMDSGMVENLRTAPYYPEFVKYSSEGMNLSEAIFGMESDLILGTGYKVPIGTNWGTYTDRVDTITELFCELMLTSTDPSSLLAHLRLILKEVEPDQLKSIKQDWNAIVKGQVAESYMREYLKLFHRHPYFNDRKKQREFLANHLHMFCNRSFPVNSLQHEREVIYVLYKKLGGRIFKSHMADPVDKTGL